MSGSDFRSDVGVIGAGRWGTVLAHVVAGGGHDVVLYASDPDLAAQINETQQNEAHLPELDALHHQVRATSELADVTKACQLILIAVSVDELRGIAHEMGQTLDGSHLVVHAVRGLEQETYETPSRIIVSETCVRKVGALLGPALVEELLAERPNAAVVASRFPEVIRAAREALVNPAMRVYASRDVVGVETAAAASNVMALAVGIAEELNMGPATLSVLVTRGVAEMARLCEALGGDATTASGLAGLGDLLVLRETQGREVAAGHMIVRGQSLEAIVSELGHLDAFEAARTFHQLAESRGVQAEITAAVHDMLHLGLAPVDAVMRLMTLAQMDE